MLGGIGAGGWMWRLATCARRSRLTRLSAAICIPLFSSAAVAQNTQNWTAIWTGGQGNWSDTKNWDLEVSLDFVSFVNNILIDGDNSVQSVVLLDVNASVDNLALDQYDSLTVMAGRSLQFEGNAQTSSFLCDGTFRLDGDDASPASLQIACPGEF